MTVLTLKAAGLSSNSKHLYNEQPWLFIYPYYRTVGEELAGQPDALKWPGSH